MTKLISSIKRSQSAADQNPPPNHHWFPNSAFRNFTGFSPVKTTSPAPSPLILRLTLRPLNLHGCCGHPCFTITDWSMLYFPRSSVVLPCSPQGAEVTSFPSGEGLLSNLLFILQHRRTDTLISLYLCFNYCGTSGSSSIFSPVLL